MTAFVVEQGSEWPEQAPSNPPLNQGRAVVTGAYTTRSSGLEVVARVRDRDSGRVLFASQPFVVPLQLSEDALEPLLQKVMSAVAIHIDHGLEHVSHVPDYRLTQVYLVTKENLMTGRMSSEPRLSTEPLEDALEQDPAFLGAALLLAGNRMWGNRFDEAARYIDHIRERASRLTKVEGLELAMFDAWLAGSSGQALRSARELQDLVPTKLFYRLARVRFAADLNRPGEVEAALADIATHIPRRLRWFQSWMLAELRRAYEATGQYDEALGLAQWMRRELPGDTQAFQAEAAALAGLGRLEELDALVDECRLMPGDECNAPSVLLVASVHLAATGQTETSIEYAERTAALYESTPEDVLDDMSQPEREFLWFIHLHALRGAERWSDYLEFADWVVEQLQPDTDDLYFLCHAGMAAASNGDRERAESVIDEMETKGFPLYAAYISGYLGDLDRAVDYVRTAIERDPKITYSDLSGWDTDFQPLWGYEPFEELIRPRG